MIPGYNTNGFAHHRFRDAADVLTRIGYRSLAVTLDHDLMNTPDASGVAETTRRIREGVHGLGLRLTIETGARFILDPFRKHQPTLISGKPNDRRLRLEYLVAAVEVAAKLKADSVSFWSGCADSPAESAELFERLVAGIRSVLNRAERHGVRLAFEPEPGMFIDTMEKFERLFEAVSHPLFGLTLDVGHVHCLGDGDVSDHLRRRRDRLWNIHLEDMRRGVHEHLPFGEGEIDFESLFRMLHAIAYQGPIHVELPRFSHDAVETARRSYDFLRPLLAQADAGRNRAPGMRGERE